jgi:hypothetical protein
VLSIAVLTVCVATGVAGGRSSLKAGFPTQGLVGDTKRRKGGVLLCSPLPWFAAAGTEPTNQRAAERGAWECGKGSDVPLCVCLFGEGVEGVWGI